jgi:hypothetical protein
MTPIYRIVTLTELFAILFEKKLKFTQSKLMEDKNEGLGLAMSSQEAIDGWTLEQSSALEEHHQELKELVYLSCWTKEPELMAMWLLYSKNKDCIRIKTTKEKLIRATKEFGKRNHWKRHVNSPEKTPILLSSPLVDDVKYVAFEEISEKIKIKYKEINENILSGKCTEELDAKSVIPLGEASFLKDKAYFHEQELRASFFLRFKNNYPYEKWRNETEKTINHVLGGIFVSEHNTNDYPDIFKIDIPDDFIDSVCFDPRLPLYIKKDMLLIIQSVWADVVVEESCVFGSKFKTHDFSLPTE